LLFASITQETGGFFSTTQCTLNQPTFVSDYSGIMGMAYPSVAVAGTQSLTNAWQQGSVLASNLFTVMMCEEGGEMFIGDYNHTLIPNYSQDVFWTPVIKRDAYEVELYGTQFGSTVLDSTYAQTWPVIVDTGTTQTFLPTTVYDSIVQTLNSNSDWTSVFGTEYWRSGRTCTTVSDADAARLNQALPNISFLFSTYTLTLAPMRSLVFPVKLTPTTTCYYPGIAPSSSLYILGITTIGEFTTIFDIDNSRVGFATSGCSRSFLPTLESSDNSNYYYYCCSNGSGGLSDAAIAGIVVAVVVVIALVLVLIFCVFTAPGYGYWVDPRTGTWYPGYY